MSSQKLSTENTVKFRIQTWVSKSVMAAFESECKEKRRTPDFILREILEDRYAKK